MTLESLIDHSVEEITSKHLYVDYVWITTLYCHGMINYCMYRDFNYFA